MHWIRKASILLATLVVAGMAAGIGTRAQAQGGGGGLPPDIAQKIKEWQKWGVQHKKLIQLGDLLAQVGEMDKDSRTQLTKPQAGKMLGILKKWSSRPSMSEDDAENVEKQIGGMMTERQLKKIATIEPPSVKMQKAGGGGFKPKPGEKFTIPSPPAKGWNPLNPETMPFEQAKPAMRKMMSDWTATLQKRAKG